MKRLVKVCIVLILLAGGFAFYYFYDQNKDVSTIEQDAIQQKDFLKDKQAALYFSSTADQDMDDKGISFAIFIDDNGKADTFQMKGLELGSMAVGKGQVFLEEKNKLFLIGDSYKEFEMKKYQHTGERVGYLGKENLFFTIFNSGRSETGGYDSNVWFGNLEGFKKDNIPYYILASGIDETEDQTILLTQDIEKNQYFFRKVAFWKNEVKVEDIAPLKNEKNAEFANVSPIVSDQKYYYVILSESVNNTSSNTVLFRINKKTLAQKKIELANYQDQKVVTAAIPYNVNNSAHMYDGSLYFVNGLGEVIAFDTKTNKASTAFTLNNAKKDGVRHNEEVFFRKGQLYVVRYNTKSKNKYEIEQYSLKSGEKERVIPIKGLDEILKSVKGKSVYSYDFKMLK